MWLCDFTGDRDDPIQPAHERTWPSECTLYSESECISWKSEFVMQKTSSPTHSPGFIGWFAINLLMKEALTAE